MYKKWKTGTALVLCTAMTISQLSAVLAKDTVSETAAEITSQENSTGQSSNEPPQAPPSGDMNGGTGGPGGQKPDGEPPQKPNGEMPDGPGQMGEGGPGEPGQMGAGGGPGGSSEKTDGQLGSWSMGGTDASTAEGDDYAYNSALYITQDGINEENSDTDRVSDGTYDDSQADGITISDIESGHNGIIIYNTPYSISNATIDLLTEADGSDTCDFSGKGSAIAAFGSDADVTVTDSEIHTAGVATMPVFADDGATVTISGSTLQSDGGTLSSDYLNTPSQGLMVAPPWILGIMGTSRCSNMMGNDTTTNVIDSETSAGAWAVLSTDAREGYVPEHLQYKPDIKQRR